MAKMTVKEFVEAVHKAWAENWFLSGATIKAIKYSRSYGMENYYVKCEDKTSHTILLLDDGRIGFF